MSAARLSPWLTVLPDAIPALLRKRDHWAVWRGEWNRAKNKYDKHICQVGGFFQASPTDPAHWTSFEHAFAAYETGRYHGLAFALTLDDGIVGFDVDHARHPLNGAIPGFIRDLIAGLDTYTEISPSNTGLRAFAFGKLPDGKGRVKDKLGHYREIKLEIYAAHFFNVTGHRLARSPATIKSRQRAINAIMEEYFPKPVAVPAPMQANTQALSIDDSAVIEIACRACNGAAFSALYYDGDTSKHGCDPSSADLALLSYIAFYSGNTEQNERLFTASALGQRDKWTTRLDYRSEASPRPSRTGPISTNLATASILRSGRGSWARVEAGCHGTAKRVDGPVGLSRSTGRLCQSARTTNRSRSCGDFNASSDGVRQHGREWTVFSDWV